MEIKKGTTPLEQQAINANLDRLGLKKNLVGGINKDAAGSAPIKGGLKALEAAAVHGALSLEGLHALRAKLGLFHLGGDGSAAAQAVIQGAALSLKGASGASVALSERIGALPPAQQGKELAQLTARLQGAADQLESAIDPKNLAHAGPAEVTALLDGYQDFLIGWGALNQSLAGATPTPGAIGLAESAARLLKKGPLFEVGSSYVTTKSKAEPTDALAEELQRWAMDNNFIGGAHLLTLTQMEGFGAKRGLNLSQVMAGVTAIREEHDVYGRLRTWAAESEKTFGRFFFTLSEMDRAAKDIGASTLAVMEALDLADRINKKNAEVRG
ncbi:MAG: hypothetical protein U1E65_06055 [Myxococcota bacterium]